MPPDLTLAPFVLPSLSPWHVESLGGGLVPIGTLPLNSITGAAWPAASLALYVPFNIPRLTSFDRMYTHNGATAADSVDVGIYSLDGTRLTSKGLTAQAGTATLQFFTFASAILLPAGRYYMALALNGTTGTFLRGAFAAVQLGSLGVYQQDLAGESVPGTLPATATFAAMAQAYLPNFGLAQTGATF